MLPAPPVPPAITNPDEEMLKRRIRLICDRIVQGKAAIGRWEVTAHLVLRILSIILSSLGSAGLIVDRVAGGPPSESGGAFWIWIVVLVFGIVLQIANELQIAQTAADARILAESCVIYEIQLDIILQDSDPRKAVESLRNEVNTVILKYGKVVRSLTSTQVSQGNQSAHHLITKHQGGWNIPQPPPRLPKKRGPKPKPKGGPPPLAPPDIGGKP
jgi:hypothetical protein